MNLNWMNLKRVTLITAISLMCAFSHGESMHASELRQSLDEIRRQHHIAGLYLVTIKNDDTNELTLGVANHRDATPIRPDHYIRLGSVSKLFMGLTALKLARQDASILTSPISRWGKPPLTNPWSAQHPVTLAQLLEHTAGLTDMSKPEWDSNTPLTLAQAFAVDPDSRRLKWPAGLHSSYSNSGAGIAAWVIEQITGKNYQQVVRSQVFEPLGLHSATYEATDAVISSLLTGYDTDGTTPIDYWHTLYPAFGGINVKISELKVLLMQFVKGRENGLLTQTELDRMHTPTSTIAARSGLTHGYGLGLYDYHSHGFRFTGHGGDADGYLTYMGFNTEHRLGFFVVINAFNYRAMAQIKRSVHEHLTSGLTPPEKIAPINLDQSDINQITGSYEPVTYRFKPASPMVIFEREGVLFTRHNNNLQPLIPVTREHFRRPNESVATIAITQFEGDYYLQSDEGNFVLSSSKDSTLSK